jgi:hypothetical protein
MILGVALSGCGGGKAPSKVSTPPGAASQTSTQSTAPSTAAPPPHTSSQPSTPRTAAPPPSREVSEGVVRASSGGISATMHASSHHPRVNRAWPVSFVVSQAGRPAKAQVRYEYLFAGQVVARRSHYRFTGSFHDTFIWPSSALGYPLTFRAVISAGSVMLNLDYQVQVVH